MARAAEKTNSGLFGDDEKPNEAKSEWLAMPAPPKAGEKGEHPYDGAPVFLKPTRDRYPVAAVWRVTRGWNGQTWEPRQFWALRNNGGLPVGFEPTYYKKFEEPLLVGKKTEAR